MDVEEQEEEERVYFESSESEEEFNERVDENRRDEGGSPVVNRLFPFKPKKRKRDSKSWKRNTRKRLKCEGMLK